MITLPLAVISQVTHDLLALFDAAATSAAVPMEEHVERH